MLSFIQPYSFDLNIGKAYNEACELLEGWICITDQDTLKFDGFARRVKEITEKADKSQVITCMTNRLRKDNKNVVHELYNESDINIHLDKFNELWDQYGTELQRTKEPIAGVFMLFHKSVWEKVKFIENAINFDSLFTTYCRNAGFTTHVAKGLYIFHLYRWNRDVTCIKHLIKKDVVILDNFSLSLVKHNIMAKVKKSFFCIQEKKTYKVGDTYTGKRKDLGSLLEQTKELKPKIKKKPHKKRK